MWVCMSNLETFCSYMGGTNCCWLCLLLNAQEIKSQSEMKKAFFFFFKTSSSQFTTILNVIDFKQILFILWIALHFITCAGVNRTYAACSCILRSDILLWIFSSYVLGSASQMLAAEGPKELPVTLEYRGIVEQELTEVIYCCCCSLSLFSDIVLLWDKMCHPLRRTSALKTISVCTYDVFLQTWVKFSPFWITIFVENYF